MVPKVFEPLKFDCKSYHYCLLACIMHTNNIITMSINEAVVLTSRQIIIMPIEQNKMIFFEACVLAFRQMMKFNFFAIVQIFVLIFCYLIE